MVQWRPCQGEGRYQVGGPGGAFSLSLASDGRDVIVASLFFPCAFGDLNQRSGCEKAVGYTPLYLSRRPQANRQGYVGDAMTFFGLSDESVAMAILLQKNLAERLDPQAENRSFWKVNNKIAPNALRSWHGRCICSPAFVFIYIHDLFGICVEYFIECCAGV